MRTPFKPEHFMSLLGTIKWLHFWLRVKVKDHAIDHKIHHPRIPPPAPPPAPGLPRCSSNTPVLHAELYHVFSLCLECSSLWQPHYFPSHLRILAQMTFSQWGSSCPLYLKIPPAPLGQHALSICWSVLFPLLYLQCRYMLKKYLLHKKYWMVHI